MTYAEQLKHPNWQRRRLEILNRDRFTCRSCGDDESTLHVHHKHYTKGRMAWEYADDELVTFCEGCHKAAHEEEEDWKILLSKLSIDGPGSKPEAYGLLSGWGSGTKSVGAAPQLQTWMFVVGEIAALIDRAAPDVEWLVAMKDALQSAPPELARQALADAAIGLLAAHA